jgi:hypothetical protein
LIWTIAGGAVDLDVERLGPGGRDDHQVDGTAADDDQLPRRGCQDDSREGLHARFAESLGHLRDEVGRKRRDRIPIEVLRHALQDDHALVRDDHAASDPGLAFEPFQYLFHHTSS